MGKKTDQLKDELAEARREIERLEEELSSEVAARDHLVRLSTQLNSTLELQELLESIMSAAKELLDAEACSVALIDEETKELVIDVSVGAKSDDVVKRRIPAGKGVAGHVAESGEALVVNSTRENPHFFPEIDRAVGFDTQNLIALPLKAKERLIGVVEIINAKRRDRFDDHDLALATALTSQAAVAIDNASMYRTLAEALVASRRSYRL